MNEREMSRRKAAVVALIADPALPGSMVSEPDLLLTRRSFSMRRQPGQMSFPGGTIDPGETPEQAAARELFEEVGLRIDAGELTVRTDLVPRFPPGFTIVPTVGRWSGESEIHQNPAEVDSCYRFTLAELADPAHRASTLLRGPIPMPVFQLHDVTIWGFTATVIDQLLADVGVAVPWDEERLVDIPADFRVPTLF